MSDLLSLVLILLGAGFMILSGLGILRLPDLYMRMSATTKTATSGVGCILLATAIHFNDVGVTSRAVATLVFLFLTAPIAAHMIGRTAYITGVKLWEGSVCDELKERYDTEHHTLAGNPHTDADPAGQGGDKRPTTDQKPEATG